MSHAIPPTRLVYFHRRLTYFLDMAPWSSLHFLPDMAPVLEAPPPPSHAGILSHGCTCVSDPPIVDDAAAPTARVTPAPVTAWPRLPLPQKSSSAPPAPAAAAMLA